MLFNYIIAYANFNRILNIYMNKNINCIIFKCNII